MSLPADQNNDFRLRVITNVVGDADAVGIRATSIRHNAVDGVIAMEQCWELHRHASSLARSFYLPRQALLSQHFRSRLPIHSWEYWEVRLGLVWRGRRTTNRARAAVCARVVRAPDRTGAHVPSSFSGTQLQVMAWHSRRWSADYFW